jgi:hypothetical protein
MKLKSMTIPLLGLGLAIAPAFAVEPGAPNQPVQPGTVNYVEGSVSVNGQAVTSQQAGNVTMQAGDELTTGQGKAEVLLTPGVFLRVDDNSTVKLISPDLANTQVQIEKGRAGVEVDDIQKENNLQIVDADVTTRLQKTGYYEFDANSPEVMVFKGKAEVELANGKNKEVKQDHQAVLQADLSSVKTEKIAEDDSQDSLYNWSRLRSHYLAEANNQMAGEYAGEAYAPGWYWNPYGWGGYTFIGGGPFMSPFGWGFYPLGWGYGWGGYYGGWGGYYGHPYYRGHGHDGDHLRRFGDTHGSPHGGSSARGSSRSFSAPRAGGFHSMGGGARMSGGVRGGAHR